MGNALKFQGLQMESNPRHNSVKGRKCVSTVDDKKHFRLKRIHIKLKISL
jgi:hypothetical protein